MKRQLITLSRVIRAGCINFLRNISLSIAATAVMVVTLTIVLFSIIANATLNNTINEINKKIDISVYLKDSVNEKQRNALIDQLKGLPNVEGVEYLSKDDVLEDYREQNQGNLDLLLAISQADNPLPATIQVKPIDPVKINDIKTVLEDPKNLALQSDETSYSGDRKEAIDKISNATAFFRKAVFAGVIVFAIISMLIIFNTIQMAIFNRRDELTIMRLLGAKPWYIRGPFIVESMIYGILAAVISISLCNFLFVLQSQAFDASSLGLLDIKYSNDYFAQNFWLFLAMQLLAGMTIGAVSAVIATQRYLKVSKKNKPRLNLRKFKR
ncbi:MAG TPA: permease-like cell division protein FtsX [Patescibacteria group bacterium]|nr:permease-like cell division protein FtsX [Patescibacteria group bacterium]